MTRSRRDRELPARVNRLRQRIEEWRRQGEPRAMPGGLWDAAVSLARAHGICPISRALRIDYGGLKRRTMERGRGVPHRDRPLRFVELGGGPWRGGPATDGAPDLTKTTVELWAADGSRLVVRFREETGMDVIAVAASLWKSR